MRKEVEETLQKLSELNLSYYPYDEICSGIRKLGKFGCVGVTLHKGKHIMRACPNFNNEVFHLKSRLSYKPSEHNKTYQRASTPNMTMFYASYVPDKLANGELDNLRVIGLFEALPWLRDNTTKGYQKMTYGNWRVKEDIVLLAVVQNQDFYKTSSYTKELVDGFNNFIKKYPELEDETVAISNFFAGEFAKPIIRDDYDYLLSATFTEIAVRNGFDGVMYPSVRVGGQGFNVAITPEAVDNFLELRAAGECSIYKYLKQWIVDNDTVIALDGSETEFKLLPVEAQYHGGEAECLKRLGLTSMDELLS